MHPPLRRAGALVATALALMPVNSARAIPLSAGNAVLLRYRFVPGQTYAYRMAMDMGMSMSGTDVPASASNETVTMGGIVRYHILRVDRSGGADAEIRLSTMTMSTTIGGHTTTTKLANQGPIAVHLSSDGRVQGALSSGSSTYGLQTIGTLPPRAVAPGARWTSTAVASLPSTVMSLAPMHMTTQNVFSRYLQVDGQRVAAIDSTGTVQYNTDSALGGTPVHMHLTAGVTGRSLFGLAAHRTVASQQHLDMRMFLSDRTSAAANAGLNMHIVMSVSLTPLRQFVISPARPSAPIDGVSCGAEMLNYHIHAHLTLYKDGKRVPLPADVGIPYSQAIGGRHYCLYWLHTHDASGVIHIESPTTRLYTLGQFFDIWHYTSLWDAQGGLAGPAGLVVDASFLNALRAAKPGEIHIFINGKPVSSDYRSITLTKHRLVTVEIGTPLKPPTTHYDFSAAD